jgi:hypothetical protein
MSDNRAAMSCTESRRVAHGQFPLVDHLYS